MHGPAFPLPWALERAGEDGQQLHGPGPVAEVLVALLLSILPLKHGAAGPGSSMNSVGGSGSPAQGFGWVSEWGSSLSGAAGVPPAQA